MKFKVKNPNYLVEASLDQALDAAEKDAKSKLGSGNDSTISVDGEDSTEIDRALSRALKTAERMKRTGGDAYTNVLLVGGAGIGKTAITQQWADRHGVNLVYYSTSTADEADITGVLARSADGKSTVKLKTDVLRGLNQPRSVLFLDEYNRGSDRIRGTLLTLIKDHKIDAGTDESTTGKVEIKNMMFTVAAINPSDDNYNTDELDLAELSRFKRYEVVPEKNALLKHLVSQYTREMNAETDEDSIFEYQGRIALANKLLTSKAFQFDNAQDEKEGVRKFGQGFTPLNPRSLDMLLQDCDGTKEDFLSEYNYFCNPMKKGIMETILADYEDVDDKANSVFKKREKSDEEKLDSFLNDF